MGDAGSGKTTVATMLHTSGPHCVYSLAAPIKRDLRRFLGREATKADRALMIEYGQAMRRIFGDTVWCEALAHDEGFKIDAPFGFAAIDDGRHLVEYRFFVEERGFVPVRIVTPDELRFERLMARDNVDQRWVSEHERELDNVAVAFTIVNDGTMEALDAQVEAMLKAINEGGDAK